MLTLPTRIRKSGKGGILRTREQFEATGLRVLRLCKATRRKLLPMLIDMTSSTLRAYDFSPNLGWLRQRDSYHVSPSIPISTPFSSNIRKLEISVAARSLPALQQFSGLERITVYGAGKDTLRFRQTLEDDAELLRACCHILRSDRHSWRFLHHVFAEFAHRDPEHWLWVRALTTAMARRNPPVKVEAAYQIRAPAGYGHAEAWEGLVVCDISADAVTDKVPHIPETEEMEDSVTLAHIGAEFWMPPILDKQGRRKKTGV